VIGSTAISWSCVLALFILIGLQYVKHVDCCFSLSGQTECKSQGLEDLNDNIAGSTRGLTSAVEHTMTPPCHIEDTHTQVQAQTHTHDSIHTIHTLTYGFCVVDMW
jgi:hypothetical protein